MPSSRLAFTCVLPQCASHVCVLSVLHMCASSAFHFVLHTRKHPQGGLAALGALSSCCGHHPVSDPVMPPRPATAVSGMPCWACLLLNSSLAGVPPTHPLPRLLLPACCCQHCFGPAVLARVTVDHATAAAAATLPALLPQCHPTSHYSIPELLRQPAQAAGRLAGGRRAGIAAAALPSLPPPSCGGASRWKRGSSRAPACARRPVRAEDAERPGTGPVPAATRLQAP